MLSQSESESEAINLIASDSDYDWDIIVCDLDWPETIRVARFGLID